MTIKLRSVIWRHAYILVTDSSSYSDAKSLRHFFFIIIF